MKQNKLKLEDCCLTIEQAKELKKLGVNFGEPIFSYAATWEYEDSHFEYALVRYCKGVTEDMIPTLTNSEMLEMLPMKIEDAVYLGITKDDFYSKRHGNYALDYDIEYRKPNYAAENSEIEILLRDALFKMIKYLKTNKLI
jgi:hypothetical protein